MQPLLSALAAVIALLVASTDVAAAGRFRVFENLLFSGKPDLAAHGIEHLQIAYGNNLWLAGESENDVPSDKAIQSIAGRGVGPSGYLVLDIENWSGPDTLNKFRTTIAKFRRVMPAAKLGIYSLMPVRDYWRAQNPGSGDYAAWKAENDQVGQLVPLVDALFPSIYTFYPDQAGWVRYAEANLAEARRIARGKPVYCFLWPQYHDSGALLAADYWMLELRTCRRLADGVVLWGGFEYNPGFHPLPWSSDASWWRATLEFLKTLR